MLQHFKRFVKRVRMVLMKVMIQSGLIEKVIGPVYRINPEMVYRGNLIKYYQKEMEKQKTP